MFGNFFGTESSKPEWRLKPSKYPKDSDKNYSSKVMLPYYILKDLVVYNYHTPYVFEIAHSNGIYKTACSVLDFALETDEVIIPSWMFEQLCLEKKDMVVLKSIEVEHGEGICLLPHSVDFLDIENPKKELEKTLTNYHVLSYGDEILLNFADIGRCRFTVTKVCPENETSIYIVDTDLKVEFDEPLGYKEKIESERSVMKYVTVKKLENGVKIVKMKKPGLLFDWDALKLE